MLTSQNPSLEVATYFYVSLWGAMHVHLWITSLERGSNNALNQALYGWHKFAHESILEVMEEVS